MTRLREVYKQLSRSVAADESAICHVKINPHPPAVSTDAGAEITTATVQVIATDLTLLVNTAAETVIGTFTGNSAADNVATFADNNATVQELLNILNGVAAGQTSVVRRWRAGLGDFRPQFVLDATSGLATAAANAMLGYAEGLICLADSSGLPSANTLAIGLGTDRAVSGGAQRIPDHFESDYSSTTAGVKLPVRSAGRKVEDQPGQALYQVALTDLQIAASFATTGLATVFDDAGNTLKAWNIGTAAFSIPGSGDWTAENPAVIGPPGSPLFIEITGTGALTDGTCTATGFQRLA